jgi:hypothetical protein
MFPLQLLFAAWAHRSAKQDFLFMMPQTVYCNGQKASNGASQYEYHSSYE